jgi:hypothetical protein
MRRLLILALLLSPAALFGQTAKYLNWCQAGAQAVAVTGIASTTTVQASMPSCTVTVYLHGTLTLATIYSDSINTPLGNPFTANTDATYAFYAAIASHYDVVTTGTVQTVLGPVGQTVTLSDIVIGGGGTGTGCSTGGDVGGPCGAQEVVGILSNPLPVLATGFLNWTGSAWAFSSAGISSVTINNGTGITGGGTGSTFTLAVTSPVVLNNQANVFTAGSKQSVTPSATTAGLRLVGVTADPSSLASGDIWFRSDLPFLNWYDGTITQSLMNQSTLVTLAQLNDGTPATGRMPYEATGGGSLAWLPPGTTGCYLGLSGASLPSWDGNLCSVTGSPNNLNYNGTITATKFIGTGPYYLSSPAAGGALTLPGASLSALAVDSSGILNESILNAAFTPVTLGSGGAGALTKWTGTNTTGSANAVESTNGMQPHENVDLQLNQLTFEGATAGTYTAGMLACVTATNTIGNCASGAGNLAYIGVLIAKNGTAPQYVTLGNVNVTSHLSASFTAGDYVCTDASNAGVVTDNGTTVCGAGTKQVGIVYTTDTTVFSHVITLAR